MGSPAETACYSKRGYMPYNLRSLNKDSYVIETDGHSGALLVAVFDGHGKYVHKYMLYYRSY